jgi:hypothetical protein
MMRVTRTMGENNSQWDVISIRLGAARPRTPRSQQVDPANVPVVQLKCASGLRGPLETTAQTRNP